MGCVDRSAFVFDDDDALMRNEVMGNEIFLVFWWILERRVIR